MERKLGIFAECLRGVSATEALPLLKKAGFTCYSTHRYEDDLKELVEIGNELGIECDSVHAPFRFTDTYCNDMWKDCAGFEKMNESYLRSIDSAAECGVPYVVIHFMANLKIPKISDMGLARFDAIVDYAKQKGVTVAFENMIRVGPLAYAVDRYENHPNVAYCYDFGHAHCYSGYAYDPDIEWLDIMQDRVVTTHVHDNNGFIPNADYEMDFHMVPFDGNLDYQKVMKKLDEYNYRGALVMEISNGRHLDMPHDEFLSMCYERIKRISDMSRL